MQQLLGDTGPAPDSPFIRELFLRSLLASVRMVLVLSPSTVTVAQLAEMADRIMEVANPPTITPITTGSSVDEIHQLYIYIYMLHVDNAILEKVCKLKVISNRLPHLYKQDALFLTRCALPIPQTLYLFQTAPCFYSSTLEVFDHELR